MTASDPSGLSHGGRLRFLARDSVVYGGAAAVSRAFTLVTFPLLARHFSVADYGVIDVLTVTANFVALLIVFGQDSAVARYFYDSDDVAYRRRVVSQALLIQMVTALVIVPVLLASSALAGDMLKATEDASGLVVLIILQTPLIVLTNFSINILKWTFQRSRFLIISLGYVALNAVLLVAGIVYFNLDVRGFFLIALFCQAVFSALGLVFVRQWIIWPVPLSEWRALLAYALPMGVISCIGAFVPVLERALVNSQMGETELGLYAAAMRISGLVLLLVQAFQMAWGPFSLSIHRQPDAGRTFSVVLIVFATGTTLAVLGLAAVAGPVTTLLASAKFEQSATLLLPLGMAMAVQGVGWIAEIGISIVKRSYLFLIPYGLYLITTVGAVLALAPILGLAGVALGVLAGQSVRAVTAGWLGEKSVPMALPTGWAFVILGFGYGMSLLAGAQGNGHGLVVELAWHALAMVATASLGAALLYRYLRRR